MITLTLFGSVAIEESGEPVKGLRSRKALALLAYVAVHNMPLARSHLAELFWPGDEEARGLANLRWVLNHLNALLPRALIVHRHAVLWGKGVTCDLHAFAHHLQRNSNATLAAAAALYRGDFMAGFVVDGVPEFELWVTGERERWLQQAIQVHATLSHHASTQNNAPLAIRYLRRWLELAPWHEEAHRRLIYWLAVSGQPSAALHQYQICQRILADELGVVPATETAALILEIQRQGANGKPISLSMPAYTGVSSLLPLPAHNLPRQLTAVVGRERELAYIAARLADPTCAWVTLLGPGGIGKSSLAVEAAYAQLLHFADGVWLISLVGITTADLLPATIAQTLAVPLQTGGDLQGQVVNYLHDKQLLLVLDNFEHLLEGVALLDALVQHAPQVKLLVTSREVLRHQAEWIVDVGGLAVPPVGGDKVTLEELATYSAVELFVQSAHRTQATFTLTIADAPHVAQICRNLAGMPLGIKLAAAWVRTLPCATISAEISRNLDFATLAPHGLPDRHQSLRAVIDSSWQRLTTQEQEVLAKLALFRREFSLEGAQVIAGATPALLARLIEQSLLQVHPHVNPVDDLKRYSLHELLCQYSLEKLAASGQLETTRATHALYYATWLAQQAGALTGSNPQPTLRVIDVELDNLRAAWQWAIQHYHAAAIVAATPVLNLYHDYRTLLEEALQLFGEAAAALQHAPPIVENEVARSKVMNTYALYLFRFGQQGEAERVLHESLTMATRHNAVAEQSYALYVLGYNASGQGAQGAQGEKYLLAGLALAEASDDRMLIVKLLYALGWHYGATGQSLASLASLNRGLAVARSLGDLRSEAHIHYYLGRIQSEMGNYDQAKQDIEASLRLFQELEVHWGIAQAEHGLIEVAYLRQDYAEAKRLCEIAIPLYEKIKAHADSLRQLRELYALVNTMLSST